jgi:ketosteroid isomerase-like protein
LPTAAEHNIALIHQGFDAFSRGDLDTAVENMEPDVEWHMAFRMPDLPFDKTVYRGRDEVRQLWAALRGVWEQLTLTLEEVLDARDHVVIVRARFDGRAAASGIEVNRTLFYVFELPAGKLKRLRPFETEAEARAAVEPQRAARTLADTESE